MYLSDTEIDHKDGTVGKTKEQFANGEVAYIVGKSVSLVGFPESTDLHQLLFRKCTDRGCFDGEIAGAQRVQGKKPGRSVLRKMGCTFINVTSLVRT